MRDRLKVELQTSSYARFQSAFSRRRALFRRPGGRQAFLSGHARLEISEEEPGRYAKFAAGEGFVCIERKGSEPYPSRDKAVVFIEVCDLQNLLEKIGREQIVQFGPDDQSGRPSWAVLHDPEGYNVLLLQAPNG